MAAPENVNCQKAAPSFASRQEAAPENVNCQKAAPENIASTFHRPTKEGHGNVRQKLDYLCRKIVKY
jgi:hypothetical protein